MTILQEHITGRLVEAVEASYRASTFPGLLAVNIGAEEAERRAREHPTRQVLRAKAREHRKADRTARNALCTAPWGRNGPPAGTYRYLP